MVKMWAEKELKNLNRLHASGIPCPAPVTLKDNVLVMEFIGSDGWPAPRLKDAGVDEDRMWVFRDRQGMRARGLTRGGGGRRACYLQTIRYMRIMHHRCRLVHGDLSEYNMLYFKKQVYVIDVSQSVELDHPRALDFLRTDCVNVTRFFSKQGGVGNALTAKRLYEFVVDPSFGCDDETEMDLVLQRLRDAPEDEAVASNVFMQSHIPRSLNELEDYEKVGAQVKQLRTPMLDGESMRFLLAPHATLASCGRTDGCLALG
jgi:RIO kinase 1